METARTHITARSEKEAMDWSLVLASQGIETFIEHSPEDGVWRLRVPTADFDRAQSSLRQYRLENRGRIWQQELRWTGLLFDWRAAFWFLLLIGIHVLVETGRGNLQTAGLMDGQAVRAGEWWRLFTAVTLHADWTHLAGNVTTGLVLLGLAMGGYGPGTALLACFLAGAGGNVAGLFLHSENYQSLGASGMVMGALGLLAVQSISLRPKGAKAAQLVGRGLLAGFLLLVLLGLNPTSDVVAHLGGFASGALLGLMLAFVPEPWMKSPRSNLVTGLLCGLLLAAAWACALR